MTPGLSPEEDAELEILRKGFHELMTISGPAEAVAGRDHLRSVQQRIGELLEIAHARLQLRVDWQPRKPSGWEECEDKIRTFLSVDAARTGCERPPVVVRIEQGPPDTWRCTHVWSDNVPCPAAQATVDLALGLCGLRGGATP
jgi:hypothetical protein